MIKKYNLRRFDAKRDMPDIYRVYSSYTEQYNLMSIATKLNSEEDFHRIFKQKLSKNYNDFFVVETTEEKFAGFIASYDFKKNDGHIKVMLYIEKEFRKNGMIALIATDFVNALFQYYNIHKIYSEVYAYNQSSINFQLNCGFIEECRLKNYRYFDGKYWDTIYFSLSREAFYAKGTKIMKRFFE